jgi:hypothetical protein
MRLASGAEKLFIPITRYSNHTGDTPLKKYSAYLSTIVLLLTTLANGATPAIAAFWAAHATAAAIVAPLAVIVAHWLLSPYAGSNSK